MRTILGLLIFGFLFTNAQAQSGPNTYDDVEDPVMNVLKFEWCRGEYDRNHKNLGEWGTEYIHAPDGAQCTKALAMMDALHWIDEHERGASLVGWGCVFYDGGY